MTAGGLARCAYITGMRPKGKAKKRVAVIGYGSQGRALALNLRDSGYDVIVGLRQKSKSRRLARRDGIGDIRLISEAVAAVEIICFAYPDHLHGPVFSKEIVSRLRKGSTLVFLHGLSIHFGLVKPPRHCDVVLLAPHAPGLAVREKYLSERTISAFYAIHQDPTGRARTTLFALAEAIGFAKKRLIKTTFRDEAVGDLFGEQVVLCGGLAMLIKTAHELLVERGLKPDNAYLEVAYQLDLIVALIKRFGIGGMLQRISVAARYGSIKSGPKVISTDTKRHMLRVLTEIESGRFARALAALKPTEIRKLSKEASQLTSPSLDRAAKKFAR